MARTSITSYTIGIGVLSHRISRKIANNTYLELDTGSVGIRLHRTTVVRHHEDGSITIQTGGWDTVTTRQRINQHLPAPYRVYHERNQLRLKLAWNQWEHWTGLPYTFTPEQEVITPIWRAIEAANAEMKWNRRLKRGR